MRAADFRAGTLCSILKNCAYGSASQLPSLPASGTCRQNRSMKIHHIHDREREHGTAQSEQQDITYIVAGYGLPGRDVGYDGRPFVRRLIKVIA
jgi:hypothetical protein